MSTLQLYFFLFVLSIGAFSANAQTTEAHTVAYIGVAGPKVGPGMLGHSFIVFAPKDKDWARSETFQYSVNFEEIQKEHQIENMSMSDYASLAQDIGNFPLEVTQSFGNKFIKDYQNEDRTVILYRLKVDESIVKELYNTIHSDVLEGIYVHSKLVKYNLLKSNCASFLIHRLNEVFLRNEIEEVPSLWGENLDFKPTEMLDLASFYSNVPFLWSSVINDHPLTEKTQIFYARHVQQARLFKRWKDQFQQVALSCQKETSVTQGYISLMSKPNFRQHPELLNELKRFINSCSNKASESDIILLESLTQVIAPDYLSA